METRFFIKRNQYNKFFPFGAMQGCTGIKLGNIIPVRERGNEISHLKKSRYPVIFVCNTRIVRSSMMFPLPLVAPGLLTWLMR